MKHKKNRRLKKIKEKIWAGASGGLLAGMMLVTANTAYAEMAQDYSPTQYQQSSVKVNRMHMMHRWNSVPKINTLINQLGLDNEEIKQELKSGKTLKQILLEHEIAMDEVQKAFYTTK